MNNLDSLTSDWKLERIAISKLVYNSNIPGKMIKLPTDSPVYENDKIHIPPVVVLRRDGINYIVNGQHTIDIVVSLTQSRDTAILCKVYENVTFDCEEEIFPHSTEMLPETEDKQ